MGKEGSREGEEWGRRVVGREGSGEGEGKSEMGKTWPGP